MRQKLSAVTLRDKKTSFMIVMVSGTNRPGSNTYRVTAQLEANCKLLGAQTQLLSCIARQTRNLP